MTCRPGEEAAGARHRAADEVAAPGTLTIAIGIATTGRPEVLGATLSRLERQTRLPDRVIVSLAKPDDCDLDTVPRSPVPVETIVGPIGSAPQRNAVLDLLGSEDLVLFLDDDFVMEPDFLGELERLFLRHPDIAAATGLVVADGVCGPGLSAEQAEAELARLPPARDEVSDVHNAYGCNMAFRLAPVRENHLRFDDRLPLYAWLEDVDFSRQCAPYGRSVRAARLRGVHLGTKQGRTSGLRFGYSQVANPIYLIGRGTMDRRRALRLMRRNMLANLARAIWAEPWIDRRGRLQGNLIALVDLLRGRLDPRRILEL